MVLLQPDGDSTLESAARLGVHVAGGELNLCAAAARLGAATAFCSRVGADPFGARVLAAARELGVDTSLVVVDPDRPTGLFLKDTLPDGQRRVHYYRRGSAASSMSTVDGTRVLAARPRLVVLSGITLALGDGPRAAVQAIVDGARAAGVRVALDPNLRPALGPIDRQANAVRGILGYTDVLLLGTDEAGPLFGESDPDGVFRAVAAAGVGETVVKAGADGCFVPDGHVPSAATRVVDPVGAGDAFAGGYLVARLRGLPPLSAAWLGTQLAGAVVGARGDTEGLPDRTTAAELLRRAAAVDG